MSKIKKIFESVYGYFGNLEDLANGKLYLILSPNSHEAWLSKSPWDEPVERVKYEYALQYINEFNLIRDKEQSKDGISVYGTLDRVSGLIEKIVKVGSKWQVQSEKGKVLGEFDTEKEAKERLRQIEYFKHKKD